MQPDDVSESHTYTDSAVKSSVVQDALPLKQPYKRIIAWRSVFLLSLLHLLAFYSLTTIVSAKWYTVFAMNYFGMFTSVGILVGAHRLWTHRSFKANLPLRLLLAFSQTMALQDSIYDWVRNHRSHHKWSETDADPHNSTRGFFFSHMGWLMVKKHPEVIRKGATLDLSDLKADPIVMFQKRWYPLLVVLIWGLIPTAIPVFGWGETWTISFLYVVIFRYTLVLHITWLVNSWAHRFGTKPYDAQIAPVEMSIVGNLLLGEGYHNYHHAFPWDYSASELGAWDAFNPATAFINFFAAIGWATELRKASPTLVTEKRTLKGDKSIIYEKGSPLMNQLLAFSKSSFVWPLLPALLIKWALQ